MEVFVKIIREYYVLFLLIGGFADLYTDPVFRLMNKLKCPKRAIIGPWGHQWP